MTPRSLLARSLTLLAGLLLAATAAATASPPLTWQALIDSDGDSATGCSVGVTDADGSYQAQGVDYVYTVELDAVSNTVTSAGLSACDSVGWVQPAGPALSAVAGGTGEGRRFVEAGVALSALGDPSWVTVVHASDDGAGGQDAAYGSAAGGAVNANAYIIGSDAVVPLLGPLALALLAAGLGGLALRRHPGRVLPLVLVAVVLGSGAAWAVTTITLDG